jgi:hypothetical protein
MREVAAGRQEMKVRDSEVGGESREAYAMAPKTRESKVPHSSWAMIEAATLARNCGTSVLVDCQRYTEYGLVAFCSERTGLSNITS